MKYTYAQLYRIWHEKNPHREDIGKRLPTREEMENDIESLSVHQKNSILDKCNYFFKPVEVGNNNKLFRLFLNLHNQNKVSGYSPTGDSVQPYPELKLEKGEFIDRWIVCSG